MINTMAVLPDVLQKNLKLVFCGTAPSHKSAQAQAYYAHSGNLFWPTLYQAGFLPQHLQPKQFHQVVHYGIGLTDLNKVQSGVDAQLDPSAFEVNNLKDKIAYYQPMILAFTSKNAACVFYGHHKINYGEQPFPFADTTIWVLPSTSGSARSHWSRLQHYWYDLGKVFKQL